MGDLQIELELHQWWVTWQGAHAVQLAEAWRGRDPHPVGSGSPWPAGRELSCPPEEGHLSIHRRGEEAVWCRQEAVTTEMTLTF